MRSADTLEPVVIKAVTGWFNSRLSSDFCDPSDPSNQTPLTQPTNVHRWMAHLLLTTTVSFAASNNSAATTYSIPDDLFYNAELVTNLDFSDNINLLASIFVQSCRTN